MPKLEPKTCGTCGTVVSCQSSLTRHIKSKHTNIKDHKCEYDNCDEAFAANCDLQRHIKYKHLKIKAHKCTIDDCEAAFVINSDLQNHIKYKHNDIRDFVCTELVDGVICGITVHDAGKLRRHIDNMHINITSEIPCPTCGKLFKSNASRNKHIQCVHLNILRYVCGEGMCDYKCFDSSDMKKHKKLCTGGEHGSYGEIMIKTVLQTMTIEFLHDSSYELMGNYGSLLRWDFIITADKPLFIEYDGEQHFSPQRFGGRSEKRAKIAFAKQQKNDKLKNDFCADNGYQLLRIPYTELSNIESLVKDFINEHITDCEL